MGKIHLLIEDRMEGSETTVFTNREEAEDMVEYMVEQAQQFDGADGSEMRDSLEIETIATPVDFGDLKDIAGE